jgi:hypothetical protein
MSCYRFSSSFLDELSLARPGIEQYMPNFESVGIKGLPLTTNLQGLSREVMCPLVAKSSFSLLESDISDFFGQTNNFSDPLFDPLFLFNDFPVISHDGDHLYQPSNANPSPHFLSSDSQLLQPSNNVQDSSSALVSSHEHASLPKYSTTDNRHTKLERLEVLRKELQQLEADIVS